DLDPRVGGRTSRQREADRQNRSQHPGIREFRHETLHLSNQRDPPQHAGRTFRPLGSSRSRQTVTEAKKTGQPRRPTSRNPDGPPPDPSSAVSAPFWKPPCSLYGPTETTVRESLVPSGVAARRKVIRSADCSAQYALFSARRTGAPGRRDENSAEADRADPRSCGGSLRGRFRRWDAAHGFAVHDLDGAGRK